jgi:acetyltransferase-like isoleucine patch superfamily enzyme
MRSFVYRGALLSCGSRLAPWIVLEIFPPNPILIGSAFRTGRNVRIHAWPSYAGQILAQPCKALIEIGDNMFINDNSYIAGAYGIRVGDNCLIGRNVLFVDNSHVGTAFTSSPRAFLPLPSKGKVPVV